MTLRTRLEARLTALAFVFAAAHFALPADAVAQGVTKEPAKISPTPLSGSRNAYRGRLEGDAAMAGRDYAVAASFYAEYRAAAEKAGDISSFKDAFERQIDALILARLPDMASKAIGEFEKAFPDLDADSLGMWKADVLTLSGHCEEASALLEPLINRLAARDPRRIRAMSSLAVAREGAGDFAKAAETYAAIQDEAGESSPLRRGAFLREILCLASSGQLQRAKDRLQLAPQQKWYGGAASELRLINLLISLKESGPIPLETAYSKARMELKDGPNVFAYNVATAFGDAWFSIRLQSKALDCYRDAFAFAPSSAEARDAACRLLNCMNSLDLKTEAADFALRHLEIFKGSAIQTDMKLQAARLLAAAGRNTEAAALYFQIADAAPAGSSLRILAAEECAKAQVDLKDFDGAASTLKRLVGDSNPGECQYLLSETLVMGRRYAEAADSYMQVAEKYPEWRERALYEAMRAYMEANMLDKALAASDAIISTYEIGDIRRDALYQRARIQELSGDLDTAAAEFVKFANAYPNQVDLAPRSLYRAGRISFMKGNLKDAERRFAEILQRYPTNPLAPNAAYWRIHAFYGLGDELAAERETWLLVEHYPESEFSFAALFSLASNYSDTCLYARADDTLNHILNMPKASSEMKAKALFKKVAVFFKAGDQDKAFAALNQLYEKYPDSYCVSDGLFLHADMLKEHGDYTKASEYYRKAMERRPDSLLSLAAIGGLADCLFCLGAPGKEIPKLEQALELYRRILATRDAPSSFRNMALYKAGRCQEQMDDYAGAMESYKSLIYRFQVSMKLGEIPDSFWAVKAANSLIALGIKRGSAEDLQSAEDALNWLKKSALLPPQELAAQASELDKARHFSR